MDEIVHAADETFAREVNRYDTCKIREERLR